MTPGPHISPAGQADAHAPLPAAPATLLELPAVGPHKFSTELHAAHLAPASAA